MNTVQLVGPRAPLRDRSRYGSHTRATRLSSLPPSANGLTGNRVSVARTCDRLRVKRGVHSTLLIVLAAFAALEAFRRTAGRLSQRNRSVDV